jgi:hypothetical protein
MEDHLHELPLAPTAMELSMDGGPVLEGNAAVTDFARAPLDFLEPRLGRIGVLGLVQAAQQLADEPRPITSR